MNDRLAEALEGATIAWRDGMRRFFAILVLIALFVCVGAVMSVFSAVFISRQVGQARDIEARMLELTRGQERATEAAEGAQSAAVAVSAQLEAAPQIEVAPAASPSGAVLIVRPPPGVSAPPIAVPIRP